MAEHYLSLPGGLTACFKTACGLCRADRLQLGAYVPGIAFLDKVPPHIDLTVEHEISDNQRLEDRGSHVILYAPAREKFPADLCHLLYGVERRALLKRDFYAVHAACVGRGDDYMLIVGHSGAGKTTLAQNLVEKHGMKLFSGNKTVVRFDDDGGLRAVAGTRTMTALDGNLDRHAYEMSASDYAPSEVKIKSAVLVRVNDGVREAQTLGSLSALHTLYPYFMDAVNADVVVNGRDVLDGTPDAGVKKRLAGHLRRSLARLPVHKYSGTMDFLEEKAVKP